MATPDDDFSDARKAIEALSANLQQPDKFAETFCEAAKKQKAIENVLKDNIRSLIETDKETREFIKSMLREVEAEDWRLFLKKGGGIIITIGALILGAILQGLSRKYLP